MNIVIAQNDFIKPNYKKIEKAISKPKSKLYYNTLFTKFKNADSLMSLEEKRHLYYGYRYHENYSPMDQSDYRDSLNLILNKDSLSIKDFKQAIIFSDSITNEYPFDISTRITKLYLLDQLPDELEFNKNLTQIEIIIDAILSSGDGLTQETAYYVIKVSNEYDIITILDYSFGGQQSLIKNCDYLKLSENEDGIEGLYFNISPSLEYLNKLFNF